MFRDSEAGAELLREFCAKMAFIHDDVWVDVDEDLDEHSSHSFLLGCHTTVVNNLEAFGDRYLEVLAALSCLPERVIVPSGPDRSPLRALLADPVALSSLRGRVQALSLHVSAFYADRPEWQPLLDRLATDSHVPHLVPSEAAFRRFSDRISTRQLLLRVGLPMPLGVIATTRRESMGFLAENLRGVFAKKRDSRTALVRSQDEMDRFLSSNELPVILEKRIEVLTSPIVHWVSWNGRRHLLFIQDQIIRDGSMHVGNRTPGPTGCLRKRLADLAEEVAEAVQDVSGVCGMDCLVDQSGEVYVTDVNPRFCSSTYPFFLLRRLGFDPGCVYAIYRRVRGGLPRLSELGQNLPVPQLRPGVGGVLLFSPFWEPSTRLIKGVCYLVVSRYESELRAADEAVWEHIVARSA